MQILIKYNLVEEIKNISTYIKKEKKKLLPVFYECCVS